MQESISKRLDFYRPKSSSYQVDEVKESNQDNKNGDSRANYYVDDEAAYMPQ